MDKRNLYKTAYSPMYEAFVGIHHAYQVKGDWMFQCFFHSDDKENFDKHIVFSERELEKFCL